MHITPDTIIFFSWHGIHLNATIAYTWLVMAIILLIAHLATRNIGKTPGISRWQISLEAFVIMLRSELRGILRHNPDPYIPYLGALFLFISFSNLIGLVPGCHPPTGSLSTTAALSISVFVAGPVCGIGKQGLWGWLKTYAEPTPIMIPFNIIGDLSRTLAMAVRLFGNILSGTMVGGVLLLIVPLFVPIVMSSLELLIGQIQAYIFTVLAAVVIGAAIETSSTKEKDGAKKTAVAPLSSPSPPAPLPQERGASF